MKLLLIHADYLEWQVTKKAVRNPEETSLEVQRTEEPLVVFAAAEKADEKAPDKVAAEAVKAIIEVKNQVKPRNLVVYPYAHLSSDLASPGVALKILKIIERELAKVAPTKRAPFGWYKRFTLKAKGHPLAELSKTISAEGAVKKKRAQPVKIVLDRKGLPPQDHRILGEDLKLFTFADEIGAGLPLWMPYGATVRHQLVEYMRAIEMRYGYTYVHTPDISKGAVYEASGHLPYFADSMYSPIDIDGQEYYLRPMNCPHHHMIFRKLVNSYRDLPLRLAEAGTVYRNELSGVTYGLIRARCFTINDSHIYVTPEQLKKEFISVLRLFDEVYETLKVEGYWFRLSLPDFKKNPDKFTGDPALWEHATREIRKAMKEHGANYKEEIGEASFYGPKIDVQIKNTLGKEETIATAQVDIVVPGRMNLTYTDKDDVKKPVIVIHRAIMGSYERFVAYLLEQTKGVLPVWLAPVQVRLLSFTDRNIKAVEKLERELRDLGYRVEADIAGHTVDKKVREAELLKVPYIIVLGDKEEKASTLAVRRRGSHKPEFGVKKAAFLKELQTAIEKKL